MVGMTGFEPATTCSQSTCATSCATFRLKKEPFLCAFTPKEFHLLRKDIVYCKSSLFECFLRRLSDLGKALFPIPPLTLSVEVERITCSLWIGLPTSTSGPS